MTLRDTITDPLGNWPPRRGRGERLYSHNDGTFVPAAKWIRVVKNDESFQDYLARKEVRWQLTSACAPWWSEQFERMISLLTGYSKEGYLKWNVKVEILGRSFPRRWSDIKQQVIELCGGWLTISSVDSQRGRRFSKMSQPSSEMQRKHGPANICKKEQSWTYTKCWGCHNHCRWREKARKVSIRGY